jgi:uncharacterized protein DUF5954
MMCVSGFGWGDIDPIRDLVDDDARRARQQYPLLALIPPLFAPVQQVVEDGRPRWRTMSTADGYPQSARDELARGLRIRCHREPNTPAETVEIEAAFDRLDHERHDEMTVAGRRYRIARIERLARTNLDGPEPPRPTDPDTAGGRPDHCVESAERVFLDETGDDGPVARALVEHLRTALPQNAPSEMLAEAEARHLDYPEVTMLPTCFGIAEHTDTGWRGMLTSQASPQAARNELADYFGKSLPLLATIPGAEGPDDADLADYARAAEQLRGGRPTEVTAAGGTFRVYRIISIVRHTPDGLPELPRSSDLDPYPPPAADEDEDEDEDED